MLGFVAEKHLVVPPVDGDPFAVPTVTEGSGDSVFRSTTARDFVPLWVANTRSELASTRIQSKPPGPPGMTIGFWAVSGASPASAGSETSPSMRPGSTANLHVNCNE